MNAHQLTDAVSKLHGEKPVISSYLYPRRVYRCYPRQFWPSIDDQPISPGKL